MMKSVGLLPGAFETMARTMFLRGTYWKIETQPLKYGCDILCLLGGADINPVLYGQTAIQGTCISPKDDAYELSMIEFFKDIPKVGICRGGQMLNVWNGGKMWQDTDHHERDHPIKIKSSGELFYGSSMHHQMMVPTEQAEILMVADSSTYVEDDKTLKLKEEEYFDDIEVVYYPMTKSLCWQGHPEIGAREEVELFFQTIHQFLGV